MIQQVHITNSQYEDCNGIYYYKLLDNIDDNSLSFYKDETHQLYRYKGVWRIAHITIKAYIILNECKDKNWDINVLDLKYIINEINMTDFLNKYKNTHIIYIPNPGNAGDCLISYGTIQLFNKIGLNYTIGNINEKYNNKLLFYGGGGNLVKLYKNCYNFIKKNEINNKIIVLPHTIKDEDELLKNLNDNVILICREYVSYNYVYNLIKNKNNILLSKDMAFYIDNIDMYKNIQNMKICNCFRQDTEKTEINIPDDNIDLSEYLNITIHINDVNMIRSVSLKVFEYLSKYEIINTNRLHMAIAGTLLHKKVNFYSNSYYKNEAVYNYSIINVFKNTIFYK